MLDFENCLAEILSRLNAAVQKRQSEGGSASFEVSAKRYLNGNLFSEEMKIISRVPTPIFPVGNLPGKGMFVAVASGNQSFLVAHDKDCVIRIFRNRCRHRGARLLANGNLCRGPVTCPYHAWGYDTSGTLRFIYGNDHGIENWPSLSLEEIPSFIEGGFIWMDPERSRSLGRDFGNLGKELSFLGVTAPRIVSEFQHQGNFNWKTGVEAFLEVYHFKPAHGQRLGSLPIHNVAVFDVGADFSRIIVPLSSEPFHTLACIKRNCHIMYFIFPNHFLLVFEDHFGWLTVEPQAINRCILKYRGLTFNQVADEPLDKRIRESVLFLKDLMMEDVAICNSIQEGMLSSDSYHLTRFEASIAHFHHRLEELLAAT
ncbi:MAG: Rieske 2Fe-2S domain-containing protein [Proteobacteria bacterium]|nr:Rieske 2Fe-2S domain-containing protein [Pseudomonadota bacterium]